MVGTVARNLLAVDINEPGFEMRRIDGLRSNVFCGYGRMTAGPPHTWFRRSLDKALSDKHEKLIGWENSRDYRRLLLLVSQGQPIESEAVLEECSLVNFDRFPHFDQVYLDNADGIHLVYDRRAYLALAASTLPKGKSVRMLAERILYHRLSAVLSGILHMPDRSMTQLDRSILDLALRITWQQGIHWLPADGQDILAFLSEHAIENSSWAVPRQYWNHLKSITTSEEVRT
jgi:hypothetical protein